jgi:WD40 repeat protein
LDELGSSFRPQSREPSPGPESPTASGRGDLAHEDVNLASDGFTAAAGMSLRAKFNAKIENVRPSTWALVAAFLPVAVWIVYLCQWEPIEVLDLAASPDGTRVVTISGVTYRGGRARQLTVWNDQLRLLRVRRVHNWSIPYRVCFSPNGSLFAAAKQSGWGGVFHAESMATHSWIYRYQNLREFAFTPDGQSIVSVDDLAKGSIHRISDGALIAETPAVETPASM